MKTEAPDEGEDFLPGFALLFVPGESLERKVEPDALEPEAIPFLSVEEELALSIFVAYPRRVFVGARPPDVENAGLGVIEHLETGKTNPPAEIDILHI